MKIVIDIDESDYKELCHTVMSIDEMDNTTQGRVYGAIVRGGMKKLPSVEPVGKHCGDCVDRNTLLSKATVLSDIDSNMNIVNHEVVYVKDIKELPYVEPERKRGKWEWNQRTGEYVCSECGCNPIYERTTPDVSEIDKYRYCRWCGAPMEVDG